MIHSTPLRARTRGHTLVETLVVLAIIGVLMASALPHYVRAIRLAKRTAVTEAKRQQNLVVEADGARPAAPSTANPDALRAFARRVYRTTVDAGDFEFYVTEMVYKATSDNEFRAYWHTLINPGASGALETTSGGRLVARDPAGNRFELDPGTQGILPGDDRPAPLGWDFIAVELRHSAIGDLGGTVLYSDGTSKYIRYPGEFPFTRTVAELSQRYMDEVFPNLP